MTHVGPCLTHRIRLTRRRGDATFCTRPNEQPSLREYTSTIRHLDAERARELVSLFSRPITAADPSVAYDADDPVTSATCGWVTLAGSTADSPADVIGHYATHLYVHEVIRLPLSVARELARHRGHLYLDKLRSITDSVAAELGTHVGGGLSLNNLRSLSATAAWSLGRHAGELSLNRVRHLAEDAALGLAQHDNELYLWGLEHLSSKAAAALSRHRGDLLLDGLTRLPGRVARHLARHAGKLHLHGIRKLDDAAARALGRRSGFLCLKGLQWLTPAQAQSLAAHRGPLFLGAVEICAAVVHALGQHAGSLRLSLPRGICDHHLAPLVQHDGPLSLSGLEKIDRRTARILAAQPARNGGQLLSGLVLDDVDHVTPPVAAILATHRAGSLSLNGITLLAEDTARELVGHPLLCLDGVTSVTDRVAGILAGHAGATLSLRGLQHVSPSGLARLRENSGIDLPRRLRDPATPAPRTVATATGQPSREEMVRIIEQIARRGEEFLRPA